MAFKTVGDILTQAGVFLQDTDNTRYTTAERIQSLNSALLEMRKLRADMFRCNLCDVQQFTVNDLHKAHGIDLMYVSAVVNYIVGQCQLRDDEVSTDARAAAFMSSFANKLMGSG